MMEDIGPQEKEMIKNEIQTILQLEIILKNTFIPFCRTILTIDLKILKQNIILKMKKQNIILKMKKKNIILKWNKQNIILKKMKQNIILKII